MSAFNKGSDQGLGIVQWKWRHNEYVQAWVSSSSMSERHDECVQAWIRSSIMSEGKWKVRI